MADDESRGVHLSDKQLVFVFMAATVAAVVVFLFGVLVGRGAQQARGAIAGGEPGSAQVISAGAPADAPIADDVPRQGGAASGGDEYSYPARLGRTPPAEQLKAVPPPGDFAPRDTSPPDVPAEPLPSPRDAAAGAPPAAPAAAQYTVQLAAVKRREEADGIVKRLKAKGYDAFVLTPDKDDNPAMFRVRVGSFKDKRQADMLAERLLREEKRYKPWVTR
jgi:cell division septation protein DedD